MPSNMLAGGVHTHQDYILDKQHDILRGQPAEHRRLPAASHMITDRLGDTQPLRNPDTASPHTLATRGLQRAKHISLPAAWHTLR